MMNMRNLMKLVENADFDQGHRDLETHTYDRREFQDKGRADTKMRNTGNYGDNAMVDEVEPLNEFSDEENPLGLEKLHNLLVKSGFTDQEIVAGMNFTDAGLQKIAAFMGCSADDVPMLMASLVTKMNADERQLMNTYESIIAEDTNSRFSFEPDALGNVTLRDAQSGKHVFLQGSEASTLLKRLKNTGNNQAILSQYEGQMHEGIVNNARYASVNELREIGEDDSYDAEIDNPRGSFNFNWKVGDKNGFGNASYSGSPDKPVISLVRVTDSKGNEFEPNPEMHKQILQAAHDYMIKA